jgi:hypothetical protein
MVGDEKFARVRGDASWNGVRNIVIMGISIKSWYMLGVL